MRPVEAPEGLGERRDEHLLLRDPGAGQLARGSCSLRAVPYGRATPEAGVAPRPALQRGQGQRTPHGELFEAHVPVAVLVQSGPEVLEVDAQVVLAAVAAQHLGGEAKSAFGVKHTTKCTDLVPIHLTEVAQEVVLCLLLPPHCFLHALCARLDRDNRHVVKVPSKPRRRRMTRLRRDVLLQLAVSLWNSQSILADLHVLLHSLLPARLHLVDPELVAILRPHDRVDLNKDDVLLEDIVEVRNIAAFVDCCDLLMRGLKAIRFAELNEIHFANAS
mmetsp:Transcript_103345/g.274925  ORF Transcript_103345/g.274925 Transcript_103345/m.274925 type:complete len:275 (-) Transcript_103345:492-1316(-)